MFEISSSQSLSLFSDPTLTSLAKARETHKTALNKRRETTLKTTGLLNFLLTQTIENFKKADAELDKQIAGLQAQNEQTKITQSREIAMLQGELYKALHEDQQSVNAEISTLKKTLQTRVDELIGFLKQKAEEAAVAARAAVARAAWDRAQEQANRERWTPRDHGGMCGGSR